jgi:hypothetical protein
MFPMRSQLSTLGMQSIVLPRDYRRNTVDINDTCDRDLVV